jgi:hypothetical protein
MNRLYMIKIGESRRKKRQYRIFSIVNENELTLIDVTGSICRLAGMPFNRITGALEASEPYAWQDREAIQTKAGIAIVQV